MMFIPVVIFIYLIYVNLLPFGGTAIYNIDVGANDLQGTAKLTGPMERVSEPNETDGVTFRNLQQGLVYFSYFPEGQEFRIGAKNNESGGYAWKDIYVPFYETLKRYPSVKIDNKQIFLINGDAISGLDEIPEGAVIAADTDIGLDPYIELEEDNGTKSLSVNVTLRGSHTLYTYIDDGTLDMNISKQDLNWLNGTDRLMIEVYSIKDELIGNVTIPDDGNQNNSGILGTVQKKNVYFSNLEKGVYRIELIELLGKGDLLIRKIEINKGKLVVEKKLFLAGDSPVYFKGKKASPVALYFKNPRKSTMRFQTPSSQGLQNMMVINGIARVVDIDKTKAWFNLSLGSSEELNTLIAEKGDVIIDSSNYFSFTKDSYFTPKKFKIVNLKPDPAWIKNNVDYVIIEYDFPEGGEWKVGSASWNVDDLHIKNNTLSFVLDAPHLGKKEFRNYTIPVDRIEIQVKIPPLWERI